jgi:hypothetical protein
MIKRDIVWLPRPSAKYPGCYPLGFEQMIPELLQTKNYAHLFCGMARTGYRIDISSTVFPDLIADVENLSTIADNQFDGAIADPPYNEKFAKELYNVNLPRWSKWTEEMCRIVKPGGYLAVMQNYVVPRIKDCQYDRILVILTRIKQYPKIVTVQRKSDAPRAGSP